MNYFCGCSFPTINRKYVGIPSEFKKFKDGAVVEQWPSPDICERSSVVEQRPSKPYMRVRFPSLAPIKLSGSRCDSCVVATFGTSHIRGFDPLHPLKIQ